MRRYLLTLPLLAAAVMIAPQLWLGYYTGRFFQLFDRSGYNAKSNP